MKRKWVFQLLLVASLGRMGMQPDLTSSVVFGLSMTVDALDTTVDFLNIL
ncbi:hypothetical protein [Scytonema sp. NUACC26]